MFMFTTLLSKENSRAKPRKTGQKHVLTKYLKSNRIYKFIFKRLINFHTFHMNMKTYALSGIICIIKNLVHVWCSG